MAPVRVYSEGELRLQLDTLKINDRYTIVDPGGGNPRHQGGFHDVQALGGGGFGVVVRARDIAGLSRAIKFLLDSTALLEESDKGTNLFVREIRLTNERPYKHIVPIIDYDSIAVGNRSISYYVSQYVDGLTLRGFERRLRPLRSRIVADADLRVRLRDLMLAFMRDVLAGLTELDAAAVVHMDLKPHNILVFPITKNSDGTVSDEQLLDNLRNDDLHAFIIDLGAGKPIRRNNSGRTTLRFTPYFFPPIYDRLGHDETDGKIEYTALGQLWRQIDLYCLGRSLESILLDRVRRRTSGVRVTPELKSDEPEKEEFWRVIFDADFPVLEGFIDRLLDLDEGFATAEDAYSAFATIPLASAIGVYDSDYLIARAEAVHVPVGSVGVDVPRALHVMVKHPTLQRLRWIQQLAFVSEIYPDGNHSRYAHSLRCLEMAKRVVMGLGRRSAFRLHFQRRDVDALLVAALLHDVGQYHFAHSIEDLKKLGDLTADAQLAAIQHDQDLAQFVCEREDGQRVSLAKLIEQCGLDPAAIYYMMSKREKDKSASVTLNLSRDIISGVIDVDRIAYLVHDSERTGVPHGSAIDVEKIVDSLTLRVDTAANGDFGLGVEEEGVSAIEVALAAVYWMYREVYWHSQNRAFMAAVKMVMMRLLRAGALSFTEYLEKTWGETDLHALRLIKRYYDDFNRGNGGGRNPLSDLAELRGLGYHEVFALGQDPDNAEIYRRISRGVTADRIEGLASAVGRFIGTNVKDGEVLVDIPLKRRLQVRDDSSEETQQERGAMPTLWVSRRKPLTRVTSEWIDIRRYSPLAAALGEFEDHSGRKIRIFLADDLIGRLSVRSRYRIEDGLREAVIDHTEEW